MALNKKDAEAINNLILRVNDLTAQVEQINRASRSWVNSWPFRKFLGFLPDFPLPTAWRPLQLVVDSTPKRDEEWDDARKSIDFDKIISGNNPESKSRRTAGFQFPPNYRRGEFGESTADSLGFDDDTA